MESGFLTFILVSSSAVFSSHAAITDSSDVVVAGEGLLTTLICIDSTVRGGITIEWTKKSLRADTWELVLFANEREMFTSGASNTSVQLTDPNYQNTGVFSIDFIPKVEDSGHYSCAVSQQEREVKKRIILLAILTVTVFPKPPVLQQSTLRLIANVKPDIAINKITWAAPGGIPMKSERKPNTGTVAKLPRVQYSDHGAYVCMVHPRGNNSSALLPFNVAVDINADKVASFTNVTHGPLISTATQAHTSFTLTCPGVQADYVLLYWQPPDPRKQNDIYKLVYQYDRWRGSTFTEKSKRLQLAGPPYDAEAGSFSFLLTPGVKDGGLYICDVFLNDNAFSQRTRLSVLKVKTSSSASKLELECMYSERSHVQSAKWKHQNSNRPLPLSSSGLGSICTTLPIPITSETAGNYTCILQLKNGQTVRATHTVLLPHEGLEESVSPPLLPSLSALLLLVPLVAAAVCVLLWRQKHISDRGIEQSLSVYSGETENIYENPEDMRQAPPEGSVYMDLKPRGEDDVYKELERYEQCQS